MLTAEYHIRIFSSSRMNGPDSDWRLFVPRPSPARGSGKSRKSVAFCLLRCHILVAREAANRGQLRGVHMDSPVDTEGETERAAGGGATACTQGPGSSRPRAAAKAPAMPSPSSRHHPPRLPAGACLTRLVQVRFPSGFSIWGFGKKGSGHARLYSFLLRN